MERHDAPGYSSFAPELLAVARRGTLPHSRRAQLCGHRCLDEGNTGLCSVFFSSKTWSAHVTANAHQHNTPGFVGDGAAVWITRKDRFAGNTKEARRVLRGQLHSQTIEPGAGPTDFIANSVQRAWGRRFRDPTRTRFFVPARWSTSSSTIKPRNWETLSTTSCSRELLLMTASPSSHGRRWHRRVRGLEQRWRRLHLKRINATNARLTVTSSAIALSWRRRVELDVTMILAFVALIRFRRCRHHRCTTPPNRRCQRLL